MSDLEGADVSPESEGEVAEVDSEATEPEETGNEAESPPAGEQTPEAKADSEDVKTRVSKLTKRMRSSDREAATVRAENLELRKQLEERPIPREAAKTLADFDYDEDKYRVYTDDRTETAASEAGRKAAREYQDTADARVAIDEYADRESSFAGTVDDYDDMVYGEVGGARKWAASPVMAKDIQLSDIGPEMAYYLSNNPEIASEIADLDPHQSIRRMVALESDLKSEKAKASKKVSDAPPPVPKIKAGDPGLEKDPAAMSDKEFAKWRGKQIAQR